ncbi:MAG: terminase small subunit [Candidatus Fimenecus sp.]
MTEKQKFFCEEYLKDLNATRAYKAVYKNIKNDNVARANSSKLLTNPNVKSYIDKKLEEMHNEKTATAQEVMEYLTSVLRGQNASCICVVEGAGEGVSKARLMKKLPDEKERLKAAELLGKRFGIFTEKLNVESTNTVVVVDDLEDGN